MLIISMQKPNLWAAIVGFISMITSPDHTTLIIKLKLVKKI